MAPPLSSCPYSAECVEEEFSEVRGLWSGTYALRVQREPERSQANGSPWPPVLSRWLAWVLLYLFIEVLMNSLMEGAFTSVYVPGLTPHPLPKAVIPY